jgi:hypothetical protein
LIWLENRTALKLQMKNEGIDEGDFPKWLVMIKTE